MTGPAQPNHSASSMQQTLLEYQAILENASVGILFTRDRKVLHCNPKYSEIFGWPHGELVGQPGRVFYLSDQDYEEIGRIATPILSSGQIMDREIRMRRKDGSAFYCHMWVKAINPNKTAEGTIWIAQDITRQKQDHQAMQELLLKQEAILENASVGIVFTRNGIVVHCNPRMEAIYGWSTGSLVGQKGSVFFKDEEDYIRFGQTHGEKLSSGALTDIEWHNARKDGSLFWCRHQARALPTTDNSQSTIWISEDISEKKRIEFSFQEVLHRQQAILDNASVAIIFVRDGRVVQCNQQTETIYGWEPDELTDQKANCFFKSREDFLRFSEAVSPSLFAGELVDVEWLNARKDGTLFWCRNRAKAIPTEDGSLSAIWINEDISEKKAVQEALARANQELENRVQERTHELQQTNARLMQEMAERQEAEHHLRASEARFRDLSRMSSDWFWEQDENFRFVIMSNGLWETNFSPDGTIGKTRWELPIVGVTQEQWAAHRGVLEAHQPFKNFVYQVETRQGEMHWFSISGNPILENGEFRGYRGVGSDITERKLAQQQVEFLAYHDPLTGLPNRLLLQDRLQQAIAHAERSPTHLALLFLDLDNFKQINDSLGHGTGDALLKEIAVRLGECVRDSDTISRQGGDEFVILLRDLSDPDASTPVLSKILTRLQDPFHAEGNEISTSVSIGVAIYPEDGTDFETLRKKADMALYKAKEAGRNAYRFFDEAMNSEAIEHLVMRNGLRRALERGEFLLHYQPQIDIASGKVIGAEALLRWQNPELGLVSPGRFIPVAEDSGMIVPIGEWVIFEACRQAVAWQRAGLPGLQMAVNLSAVQFRRGNVEATVIAALQQSGLDPALLELELTESILIQNVEQVLAAVKRLKQLGVKLSIDDFGTGYSSLSYLKRFDIDKLKIDQSFVRDLATDPDDAAIVRAIIQMAHSLNLSTIAEGVETPDMLQRLRDFQCDEAQGYHFARPMAASEFAAFLSKSAAV